MKTFQIVAIACVVFAMACGGDKGSKGKNNDANSGPSNAANNDGSDDNLQTVDGPVGEDRAKSVITDRICEAYEICGCGEIAGVDLTNCRQGLQFSYDAATEQARSLGLTYDGACVERLVNAMANRGCTTPMQQNAYCREENCLVYYGTKGVGESCEGGLSWSDCQQGLLCAGECREPCTGGTAVNLPEGGVCYNEQEGFRGTCAEGLQCDTTGDGTCKSLPTVGQPCLQGALCGEGLWCNRFEGEPFICEPLLTEGAACTYPVECETSSCIDGVCGPLPLEGEPCVQNCADDLVCAFDGESSIVCTRLPGEGEACLMNNTIPCEEGLTCDGTTCRAKPAVGESCGNQDTNVFLQCEEGAVCGTVLCRLKPGEPGCAACAGDDSCTALVCQQIPPAVCGDSGFLLY